MARESVVTGSLARILYATGAGWVQLGRQNPPPPPANPGRPEGANYVKYEDLYVSGDNLQDVINRVTGGKVLTFPEDTFIIPPNFSNGQADGVRMGDGAWGGGCRGLAGTSHNTIFKMESDNHDKQPLGTGDANPFCLIDAYGPEVSSPTMVFEFRNFRLEGTTLGANSDLDYNGLRLAYAKDTVVDHVLVTGVNGSDTIPPGETGGIATYHTDGLTITDCEIDGRRDGTPSSATGLLMNRSTNTTVKNYHGHHNKCGACGGAWWHCDHILVQDSLVDNMLVPGEGGACWNHEESDHIEYDSCSTLHGTVGSGPHYTLNSVGSSGPPEVPADPSMLIKNPTWDTLQYGSGQLWVDTWGGDQHASKPPTVLDAQGNPLPFYWSNPFGNRWINQ